MKLWAVKIRIWALKWGFVPTIEGLEAEGVAWILKMMGKILKMPLWRLWTLKMLIWTLKRRIFNGMDPLDPKKGRFGP